MIASNDTYVMVSALYHFKRSHQKSGLKELSIINDTCPSVKYMPLHKISENTFDLLVNMQAAVCDTSKIRTKLIALKMAYS